MEKEKQKEKRKRGKKKQGKTKQKKKFHFSFIFLLTLHFLIPTPNIIEWRYSKRLMYNFSLLYVFSYFIVTAIVPDA